MRRHECSRNISHFLNLTGAIEAHTNHHCGVLEDSGGREGHGGAIHCYISVVEDVWGCEVFFRQCCFEGVGAAYQECYVVFLPDILDGGDGGLGEGAVLVDVVFWKVGADV
jgi:hypothetical protein